MRWSTYSHWNENEQVVGTRLGREGNLKSLFQPNVNVNKHTKIFAQIKTEISIGFDVDICCLEKSVIQVVVVVSWLVIFTTYMVTLFVFCVYINLF